MKSPKKKGEIKLFSTTLALIFFLLALVLILFMKLVWPHLFTRIGFAPFIPTSGSHAPAVLSQDDLWGY
jgi:hypothetical protein